MHSTPPLAVGLYADVRDDGLCEWIENQFDVLANVGKLKVNLVVDFLHHGQEEVAKGILAERSV